MNVRTLLTLTASCMLLMLGPVATSHADVTVTAADPTEAPQGTVSLDVTISGNGFDSSAQVQFLVAGTTNPGGITVRKVSVRGSKKLIATIDIADTATVAKFDIEVALSSGRKGKGSTLFTVQLKPSADPCAQPGLDFPAFTYHVETAKGQQIYVADATGQCSRPLYLKTSTGGTVGRGAFSYPVDDGTVNANVGRVIWPDGADTQIYGITFTVTGLSTITVGEPELIYEIGPTALWIQAMDLSKDGTVVYAAVDLGSSTEIVSISAATRTTTSRYLDRETSDITPISVNEDGTLFVRREIEQAPYVDNQLLRIGPACHDSSCATVLATSPYGQHGLNFPAASLDDDRLVYSYDLPGYTACWLLQVILDTDTSGTILNSSQPRYGMQSSWYGGKILTNGRKPPTRRGTCDATGFVTQVDPDTGAETQLVKGQDPHGR